MEFSPLRIYELIQHYALTFNKSVLYYEIKYSNDQEKQEIEQYIDGRLATLEVILNKTMDAVSRGRDRLAGANDKDVLSQLADD